MVRSVGIKVEFEIKNLKTSFDDDSLIKCIKEDIKENWETHDVIVKINEIQKMELEDVSEIIRNNFDCDSSPLGGLNNIKIQCGIFTNDSSKAKDKIIEIKNKFKDTEIERLMLSKNNVELRLKNGNRYVWIRPIESSKGYRCKKAIIDTKINLEQLNEIVFPICCYCGRNDIEII